MSKTVIKYVVKLNRIPERFTNGLLDLHGIGKLELIHKSQAKFLESSKAFVEKKVPALRLQDKHFVFKHIVDDACETPVFKVFDKEMKLRETIEPGTLSETDLTARIIQVDKKLKMAH
jgi:hypothetical protein